MELDGTAETVLAEYGITDASLTFLRHNENAVYKVKQADGSVYILRLHIPAPGLSGESLMHSIDWLEGELGFIQALHEHSEIVVQQPILTASGSLLVDIPEENKKASLLSWLPGETFDQTSDNAVRYAEATGRLAAEMHNFVLSWPDCKKLKRPLYDSERIKQAIVHIEDGITLDLLTESLYTELVEATDQICKELDRENQKTDSHGLIHADLGLGNLIINRDTVSPIDFGLSGHGPLLFDVGCLMGTFDYPALRKAVIDGYSKVRPLSRQEHRVIEDCFISSVFLFMALHLHNKPMQEWFGRRLPVFTGDYIHPFINGEYFLPKLICNQ